MNKLLAILLLIIMSIGFPSIQAEEQAADILADGVYLASFQTDSGMFRLNETCDGKGILTVADGTMTIHITLLSKNYLNAFAGSAEEAVSEGAVLIQPTTDQATYSDGFTDTVYGFDIPVPEIGQEFTIALVGKKGKWYSHTVCVTDPEPIVE